MGGTPAGGAQWLSLPPEASAEKDEFVVNELFRAFDLIESYATGVKQAARRSDRARSGFASYANCECGAEDRRKGVNGYASRARRSVASADSGRRSAPAARQH